MARSLAALVGYLPTLLPRAGRVRWAIPRRAAWKRATWAIERRHLIHLIRVKGRTVADMGTTLSARMLAISFHRSYLYPSQLPPSLLRWPAAFDLLCILIGASHSPGRIRSARTASLRRAAPGPGSRCPPGCSGGRRSGTLKGEKMRMDHFGLSR